MGLVPPTEQHKGSDAVFGPVEKPFDVATVCIHEKSRNADDEVDQSMVSFNIDAENILTEEHRQGGRDRRTD